MQYSLFSFCIGSSPANAFGSAAVAGFLARLPMLIELVRDRVFDVFFFLTSGFNSSPTCGNAALEALRFSTRLADGRAFNFFEIFLVVDGIFDLEALLGRRTFNFPSSESCSLRDILGLELFVMLP